MENEKAQAEEQVVIPVYVWVIGALLLLVGGWFGFKMLIAPFAEYRITLVDGPKEAMVGVNATFTWRVDGPATTINHTSVHFGSASNPGELGKEVKPADTRYTDLIKDFANGNYSIPLQFVGNIQLAAPGTYYYRVHAAVKDKNYWSPEYTIEVKPAAYAIKLIDGPKEIGAGDVATFTWRLDGPPTKINHTSVHFGTTSNPGVLDKKTAPADTSYEDLVKDFASGTFDVPLLYVGNAKIATAGAYFYRAHAIINGEHYWTDEQQLTVNKKTKPTPTKKAGKESPTPVASEEETPAPGTGN